MMLDHDACYRALLAHDRRFDGRFFVGVRTTGIYCRPVCAVRAPKAVNCRFFAHAAQAEAAGFRPCLRCRPELAPGVGYGVVPIDAAERLAHGIAQRIDNGELNHGSVEQLAARFGVTDRHLRRVFRAEFGVSPLAYAQTQRLLLAKRLLTDTALAMTDVALAAGFGSLRRFNSAFREHYGLAPAALRRHKPDQSHGALTFDLSYRPPFDWERLLAFLGGRTIAGVDHVDASGWRRTVRLDTSTTTLRGWIAVSNRSSANALRVQISPVLLPALAAVLGGVRRVFDLGCEPIAVAEALGSLAQDAPGLRVPGAFDGFEMAVRAILGQQVTVKAAHTLAGRLVARFGQPLATPHDQLTATFPSATELAGVTVDSIAALGIVSQRARALVALATEVREGGLDLSPGANIPATMERLRGLPGIGEWTAQYIALRALGWPDAWPSGDVALMKALGMARKAEADACAEQWRPWRGYAALHLWRRLSEGESSS